MAGWGRRFRIAIQGTRPAHQTSRSSGICSRRGPAAAPRRPATAGPAPANGRRPAASSSAASKSPRCASRCSSRRTSSARIPAATGSIAAAPAGSLEMVVETAEPALGNTAGDGVQLRRLRHPRRRGRRCRTATCCIPATTRAARDQDQGSRHRDPPRRPSRPRIRRRRRLGRPGKARPRRDRRGCRERLCDAMTARSNPLPRLRGREKRADGVGG